jgi:hypothetical protein
MFKHSILRHLLSTCVFAAANESGTGRASVPSAGKSQFAHLARKAEDDDDDAKKKAEEDKKKEDKEEEEKAKKKAEDDKKKEEETAAKKKAEDDKKKEDEEAKADDGDDDSDKDDDDDAKARAARARERGRIRAIVTSDAGKANPVGAMELACGTSMTRKHAIGMLKAMGVPAPAASKPTDALRSRMAGVDAPDVGNDAPGAGANASPVNATAAAIVAAGKKRRGEKA